jgi:hypothetical protein
MRSALRSTRREMPLVRIELEGVNWRAAADNPPSDARFEVLGSPYSLLSVTLSASQKLYTRRGTLVGVAGKPDNVR